MEQHATNAEEPDQDDRAGCPPRKAIRLLNREVADLLTLRAIRFVSVGRDEFDRIGGARYELVPPPGVSPPRLGLDRRGAAYRRETVRRVLAKRAGLERAAGLDPETERAAEDEASVMARLGGFFGDWLEWEKGIRNVGRDDLLEVEEGYHGYIERRIEGLCARRNALEAEIARRHEAWRGAMFGRAHRAGAWVLYTVAPWVISGYTPVRLDYTRLVPKPPPRCGGTVPPEGLGWRTGYPPVGDAYSWWGPDGDAFPEQVGGDRSPEERAIRERTLYEEDFDDVPF